MISFKEQRILPFSAEQLFNLIIDVESYKDFIPWIEAIRIEEKGDDYIISNNIIKYKSFRKSYISKTSWVKNKEIEVTLIEGVFDKMNSKWELEELDQGCLLKFSIDFCLKISLLEKFLESKFNHFNQKIIECFLDRANKIYNTIE